MAKIERALLSVYDKEGLEEFASGLHEAGVRILASGGTAAFLGQRQVPVDPIAEYTGAPEILDGRVKTLHPKIFGGILARATDAHRHELAEHGISLIDLVVVNLYPFATTAARAGATALEVIEMIDIGGVSLVRAAAKNHERTTVVVDPADYSEVLGELRSGSGQVSEALRLRLAAKAFAMTSEYDRAVAVHLQPATAADGPFPSRHLVALRRVQQLRYGENPHQRGALYREIGSTVQPAVVDCEQLQGKELSFNNILDLEAALSLLMDLPEPGVCILKHNNPCGAAVAEEGMAEAFRRARATDPVSAFGGIVGCNQTVTAELAQEIREIFIEAVIAPGYEDAALKILAKKKKLRLLRYSTPGRQRAGWQLRSVSGGFLVQEIDDSVEDLSAARVVTDRAPTQEELRALDFSWRVCKHVKSNAIVFGRGTQLLGVGAGQMSRVDSVKLAATKAQLPLKGSVVASDAFFPFRDGLDAAREAGATAVVQPGGSIRDDEVIQAANEHGMAMVFTGVRHFRH